jgi:hypothetical protein
VTGVALVRNVFSDKVTPHPHGAYYAFELVWRGGIYGAVDALLLTVLPCLVAYRALGGPLNTWRRRIGAARPADPLLARRARWREVFAHLSRAIS